MFISEAIKEFGFYCKIRKLSLKPIFNYQKFMKQKAEDRNVFSLFIVVFSTFQKKYHLIAMLFLEMSLAVRYTFCYYDEGFKRYPYTLCSILEAL